MKYLGVMIDDKFNFLKYIEYVDIKTAKVIDRYGDSCSVFVGLLRKSGSCTLTFWHHSSYIPRQYGPIRK